MPGSQRDRPAAGIEHRGLRQPAGRAGNKPSSRTRLRQDGTGNIGRAGANAGRIQSCPPDFRGCACPDYTGIAAQDYTGVAAQIDVTRRSHIDRPIPRTDGGADIGRFRLQVHCRGKEICCRIEARQTLRNPLAKGFAKARIEQEGDNIAQRSGYARWVSSRSKIAVILPEGRIGQSRITGGTRCAGGADAPIENGVVIGLELAVRTTVDQRQQLLKSEGLPCGARLRKSQLQRTVDPGRTPCPADLVACLARDHHRSAERDIDLQWIGRTGQCAANQLEAGRMRRAAIGQQRKQLSHTQCVAGAICRCGIGAGIVGRIDEQG